MKLLFKLLVFATLTHSCFAVLGFNKKEFREGKYRLHKEPVNFKNAVFSEEVVDEKWIEQRLDNFNPQDATRWQMRYMENNFFLQDGGPIFIFVGGEWTISNGTLLWGHMYDMARELNGTMFYTEHRYYGQSRPVPDLLTKNMRFLNIDQALADLAHFIVHIKRTTPGLRNSGVILVGGSYSATMVTWFMQKYPHLANGAWSSSAPLEAKVDFVEYKEVVSESFEHFGGSNCTSRIRRAFAELERLVEEGDSERIQEVFGLCTPLDLSNQLDVWSLFSDLANSFSGIAQYHSEFFRDIQWECENLENTPFEDDMVSLAWWWWYPYYPNNPENPNDGCYDHRYSTFLYFYGGTSWNSLAAYYEIRQWLYQTCAEYGWYQSSGSDNILFGSSFPVESSLQWCLDLYNRTFSFEDVYGNAERTNVIFGAKNPSVRNVYSTHGQFDPWRPMGVQEDINDRSPTVILPNESHCSDLGSISDWDTPELRASKERVADLVRKWLELSPPATD